MNRLLLALLLLASPAMARSTTAVELEQQRLEALVKEMDHDARVEAAFNSAREVMQEGPVKVRLSDQAVLALPKGYLFVPSSEAAAILRAWGSRPGADMLGMVLPGHEKPGNWFVVLHFNAAGYVRDDEAKNWSPEALIASLKAAAQAASGTGSGSSVQVLGWIEPPRYDAATHQLVWSLAAGETGKTGHRSANYNTYSLGREGYVSMNLVADAREIEKYKPAVRELLAGLGFRDGKRYEDFNAATDRPASHGLTALIAADVTPVRRKAPEPATAASGGTQSLHVGVLAAAMVLVGAAGIWFAWHVRGQKKTAAALLGGSSAPGASMATDESTTLRGAQVAVREVEPDPEPKPETGKDPALDAIRAVVAEETCPPPRIRRIG